MASCFCSCSERLSCLLSVRSRAMLDPDAFHSYIKDSYVETHFAALSARGALGNWEILVTVPWRPASLWSLQGSCLAIADRQRQQSAVRSVSAICHWDASTPTLCHRRRRRSWEFIFPKTRLSSLNLLIFPNVIIPERCVAICFSTELVVCIWGRMKITTRFVPF